MNQRYNQKRKASARFLTGSESAGSKIPPKTPLKNAEKPYLTASLSNIEAMFIRRPGLDDAWDRNYWARDWLSTARAAAANPRPNRPVPEAIMTYATLEKILERDAEDDDAVSIAELLESDVEVDGQPSGLGQQLIDYRQGNDVPEAAQNG